MTDSQKLALRRSEIRQRLNELQGAEALTDVTRAEMDKLSSEYRDVETRWRASVAIEDAASNVGVAGSESRELQRMEGSANLGNIVAAVFDHRQVDGVEGELQKHYGLSSNYVPLSMLSEDRAVTPAPANVNANQNRIVPQVFPRSAAAYLGIPQPSVGVGEQVYPVLTTGASVGTPAEGASQSETTGAFSAMKLSPQRFQASFYWSREDQATFVGMADALRQSLRGALSDKLDQYILADSTVGLLGGGITAPTNSQTSTSTWAQYKEAFTALVDGTYADTETDLSIVVGSTTWSKMRAAYRTATASDSDAVMAIKEMGATIRVSAHIPAVASNKQDAIATLGSYQHSVSPIWSGIGLIPDEISLSKTGGISLTAYMMAQFQVLRTNGIKRIRFDVR